MPLFGEITDNSVSGTPFDSESTCIRDARVEYCNIVLAVASKDGSDKP